MTSTNKQFTADPRIRQIQAQQDEIEKYVRIVLNDLRRIESGELWDYWVVIKESSKFSSHKKQLKKRLDALRRQLDRLKRQRREVRLAILESNARKLRRENRIAAREILQRAVKRGGDLSSDEERKLRQRTEASLRAAVGVLKKNPSRRNMTFVLESLSDVMLVGGSESSAFKALGNAASARYRAAESSFRKKPSGANLRRMMKACAEGSMFGDESGGFPPKPDGLTVPWPERTHLVKPGDTLAGISKEHYGSPGYWDIIYVANYGLIGDNYRQLRPHTVLQVPGNKFLSR